MAIISEIIDVILMTFAVGYIFLRTERFSWKPLLNSCLMISPAIIVHELGHKFVAMLFGLQATFNAAYQWLVIGVALKLLHSPVLFFIPAYVSIECAKIICEISPLQSMLISFAGPGINLLFYITSLIVLRKYEPHRKGYTFWVVSKQVNLLLFILNMLPIPGIDGFKIYQGIYNLL